MDARVLQAVTCLLAAWPLLMPDAVLAQGGGDLNPQLMTPQESLDRWRSLRVGTFIHWSPAVAPGAPSFHEFKAEGFDPQQWVDLLRESGFKYVVFTAKHGDAVCMWDTKQTTRNVMHTLLNRDVVGELVAECRKQGLEFCPYYAIENFFHPDWTNALEPNTGQPDYSARQQTGWSAQRFDPAAYDLDPGHAPDFERYVRHLKAQMRELTQQYGPFLAWWYDQRAPSWTHARGSDLYAYMRGLQPDVLLSHRVDTCYDRGLDNPTWFVTEGRMAGDYAQSEISVPRFNRDTAWEYCRVAGIEGTTWYWKPNDVYRPLSAWILDIVNSACRDGNFLLGIGPMPDGRFEPRLAEQLRQLGRWLKQNGQSIYGTRGGPFKPTTWYGSTCRGNTVYVHLLKTDDTGTFTLPPIGRRVVRSRLLAGGTLTLEQTDRGVTGSINKQDLQPPDTVVVLELDGSAEEMVPLDESILNADAKVTASGTRGGQEFGPARTLDGDRETYWTTDEGVTEGSLEYDLGEPCTFSRAILDEGDDGWIRHVRIQAKVGDQWKTAFEYRHGNPELWKQIPMELFCPEFKFEPVTAQLVKVTIVSATQSPVVREFKLYAR